MFGDPLNKTPKNRVGLGINQPSNRPSRLDRHFSILMKGLQFGIARIDELRFAARTGFCRKAVVRLGL